MRSSHFPLATIKEIPSDVEVTSHRLMLRAGLIRPTASGIYTWMPLGLRVLQKIAAIVRAEMLAAGAFELLMPSIQPAELWRESKRWDDYGPELLRLRDRHQRDFVFGPTHEECIVDTLRHLLKSYKQLPLNYFQIQTKFRDEIRPRFGIMRAREFLMKDAYSFHNDEQCLDATYQRMYDAYTKILQRLQLDFRAVLADTGNIGGQNSHEFHVLAATGEDEIAFANSSDYAANVEMAPLQPLPPATAAEATETMSSFATPHSRTIAELDRDFSIPPSRCVKTLIVKGRAKNQWLALLLRGDHRLNAIKAAKHADIASPLQLADDKTIRQLTACSPGCLGPVGLQLPIIADYAVVALSDFVCGANQDQLHYKGVNWQRDIATPPTADLRNIQSGDPSPDGHGRITVKRGIEVGHIFKLGTKYSTAMNLSVLNQNGQAQTVTMGCYGMGISRLVAAAIEQNHDQNGIVWPPPIAPFQLVITPIQYQHDAAVRATSDKIYEELCNRGLEVLLDDRDLHAGALFADADLIGVPYRLTIGAKDLKNNQLEYKIRKQTKTEKIALDGGVEKLLQAIYLSAGLEGAYGSPPSQEKNVED